MLALLQNPDQLAYLREDPEDRLPSAVEEMLRWVTPTMYNRRMAKQDIVIRGKQIRAGDKGHRLQRLGQPGSGCITDPDVLDVTRRPNPHLAFSGQGAHFCLGAHVARAEAIAMLDVLIRQAPGMRIAGEITYEKSNMVMGPEHMPVEL